MDLQPDRSVIKSFLEKGIDTYIIDWGYPAKEDMYLTLEDHIEWYMDDCVDYIIEASGQPADHTSGSLPGRYFQYDLYGAPSGKDQEFRSYGCSDRFQY